MTPALMFAALSMGLFGSPHCLGMCGGIVAAFGISMQNLTPTKRYLLITGYHLGRLASYMILGVIASIFGKQLLAPFLTGNDLPRYLLGGALVFVGLMMLGLPVLNQLEKLGLKLWNALAPIRSKVLPMNTLPKALAAGVLWGFLPCGMVYGALVVASSIAIKDVGSMGAIAFMALFWLGTLPMLLATGTVIAWLRNKIQRFNLRVVSGVILVISGLLSAFAAPIMHSMHGDHGDHTHQHATHEHNNHTHQSHDSSSHHDHQDSHQSHNHQHGNHDNHTNHQNNGDHANHDHANHDHSQHNHQHRTDDASGQNSHNNHQNHHNHDNHQHHH